MSSGFLEIALVGAHMTGLPLNGQVTALGAHFVRETRTEACYRLYLLPGGPPRRPGLLRVAAEGVAIALEIWAFPLESVGALLAAIPAPLGLGTVRLDGGLASKGFLVEAEGVGEAEDISRFGGWRAFLSATAAADVDRAGT